ncbi:MAG: uracil-DNA glycosylase [Sphingobium sp.]|nr:MAG: uracil-DNA glycosylase [Sphingobium sp.]
MRGLSENGRIEAVEALMGWWSLAGVDDAVGEAPVDWLRPLPPRARTAAAAPSPAAVTAGKAGQAVPRPPALPDTLDAFHAWLAGDGDIPEAKWNFTRLMPSGHMHAPLMVVCDLPDPADMDAGTLLSGEAGILFDAILRAIGHSRDGIYLASLAVSRPPAGILSPEDEAALATRMRRQISLAAPKRLLLLGERTNRVLSTAGASRRPVGLQSVNHDGGTIEAVGIFPPAMLLRQPAAKADCWRALQNLIEV